MTSTHVIDIFKEPRRLDELTRGVVLGGVIGGALLITLAWFIPYLSSQVDSTQVFYFSWLVGVAAILATALGALFFVILHHATGAGWGIVVRRLAEGVSMTIPFIGLLMIPILQSRGFQVVYEAWGSDSPLVAAKGAYLSYRAFLWQIIGYFVVWTVMASYFFFNSRKQDQTGDPAISARLRKVSYPCIIIFALTLSMTAFNMLMAVDPTWFSTIFGVYYFAGAFLSFNAFLVLTMFWLQRQGRLARAITVEHYHDVGKLTFAFTVFWAYIAFSQYMLIWYANLPEETHWFRQHHRDPQWAAVSWVLILGHFFLPFFFLMSRHIKRNPRLLALGAGWVILMHWLDMFWLVMPRVKWGFSDVVVGAEGAPTMPSLMLASVLAAAGFYALLAAGAAFWLRNCSLVPERDPRLIESLALENF